MILNAGVQQFQAKVFPLLVEHFEILADGQAPPTLFVTCSDSRIDPSLVTQSRPGQIFVLRNAGNLVPPPGQDDGSGSAVEYAVNGLKVQHIVVCGHSGCGAMTGLMTPGSLDSLPVVARWVEHAAETREACCDAPEAERTDRAIRHNALAQLENLRSHPSVAAALEEGRLELHAWVYNIGTGAVDVLSEVSDA